MKIYSLDVLLSLFVISLLFHVWFELLLLDLHTDFSGGRSGGLVFPSLLEFSTVVVIHTKALVYSQWSRSRCFYGISLAFSMIQCMLAIWLLVPLPFLNPAWKSGSSWFTYSSILAWRTLSIAVLKVLGFLGKDCKKNRVERTLETDNPEF